MSFPKNITIALAGNPNAGKTTIFNALTGTRQKVGNWPGVTVEKKEGFVNRPGYRLRIVDLPGIYSLTPFSIEEIVARDFLLEQRPDIVIDIIDASNLERSLYLATQLRELDCKVLFVLNMADVAQRRGIKIDDQKISELLSLPVVFTVGNKAEGIETLLETAIELAETGTPPPQKRRVKYSRDVEAAIADLASMLDQHPPLPAPYSNRWLAIKLLENDSVVVDTTEHHYVDAAGPILQKARALRRRLEDLYDEDPEIVMTDERYGFIAGIVKETETSTSQQRMNVSRKIDLVLTNRFLGFPIFILLIWLMFELTFSLGEYPMGWIEAGVGLVSAIAGQLLPDGLLKALVVDGIIAGVGSVIVFLPNILILFFCIALFEDTGYLARAAFLMDRIMHMVGLHGKSFIPMLMGFGCNVPAVMASRTLESEKDRVLTILITPFMSCSAKLPVYIVLAGSFFAANAGTVIFCIYLVGIVLAVISGKLFRSTLFKGEDAPFVMELPPYRVPMLKSLLIHMWDRSRMFLRKMGGLILVGSIVIWALSAFPRQQAMDRQYEARIEQIRSEFAVKMAATDADGQNRLQERREEMIHGIRSQWRAEQAEGSAIGHIGKLVRPIFEPLGLDWRAGVALLSGFVAKEIVVSTMGVLHATGDESNAEALRVALKNAGMSPLSALSMMLFVLLYLPCLATISAIRRETGSFRWMAFSVCYNTSVAWLIAFGAYQIGTFLGFS